LIGYLRGLYREPWFFWLLFGFISNQASVNLLRPVASYKALAMGVDPATLGALSAVYSFAPLLIALRIGRLVDQKGEIPFIVGGSLIMGISGLGMSISDSAALLYLWYAGLGLGQIIAVVAVQGMVARGADDSRYDARFAAFSFSASIGQGVGPAIGGVLVGSATLPEISFALLVGALIALLILPAAAMMRPPDAKRQSAVKEAGASAGPAPSLLQILRTPGIFRAIFVSTTILSSIDILIIYMPALGEERGWAPSLVGSLLGLRALSTMGMRVFLARLSDRYGRAPLLKGSMAVAAVALVLIAVVDIVPLQFVIMIAAGAGLGIGQPLTMAWVASVAAPGTRATALAVRLMGNRVGQVALPVAAGAFAAAFNSAGVIGVTGLVIAGSLASVYGGLKGTPSTATPVT
jgi:MFS family permease